MTTDNNFAGRDGHVTFVGVVEGRDDPAKMGRLRVRIIGLHTDDTNIVPTEDLPWAQVVAPINGARNFSLPKDGEWVHGFFQDGYNSQMPVVTGIFVGIQSEEPSVDDGSIAKIAELEKQLATLNSTLLLMTATGGQNATAVRQIQQQKAKIASVQKEIDDLKQVVDSKPQKGFRDRRSQRQIAASPNPPAGVKTERQNEPVLPALARGIITNTGIEVSNANREHVCDFALYVRYGMAGARIGTGQIAQAIRTAIQAVMKALGSTPGGSALAEQIKTFARMIKRAADMLKEINDYITIFTDYVKKINALIQYILSLPEKLLAMFKRCLTEAYAELAEGMRLIVANFSGVGNTGSAFSDVSSAASDAISATKELLTQTAKLYAAPATVLGALTNPTQPLTEAEAKELVSGLFPDSQEHNSNSYSGALI
jgi:predicted RNA-binding protein YlqC (UPF0109 family)